MKKLTLAILMVLAGCDKVAPKPAKPTVEGYADLKFGMSFQEATALTGLSIFSPIAVQQCARDEAIRGCLLNPINNTTAFITRDGIGYTLSLAFNKHDKLTDITLHFQRSQIQYEDEEMSRKDCAAIGERTIDWLAAEFGPFDNKQIKPDKSLKPAKTAKGNPYLVGSSGPQSYFSNAQLHLDKGRLIFLIGNYMVIDGSTDCMITAQFGDSKEIDRWSLSPKEQRELDSITDK